jgi:hypothetical protein
VGFPSELFPALIITVKGTDVAARPDAYGYYLLNHVPPGERVVEVQGLWYSESEKNRQKTVTLNSGQLLRGVNFIFDKGPLTSGQTFEKDAKKNDDMTPKTGKTISGSRTMQSKTTQKDTMVSAEPRFDLFEKIQGDTDLPGNNYRNFDLKQPDPDLCLEACQKDSRCKAFTFVKPGVQGQKARCWLKDAVPPAKPSSCCISGVKR